MAIGYLHSCLLHDTGKVYCGGIRQHGRLGDGQDDSHYDQTLGAISGLDGVVYLAAGTADHTCALNRLGEVLCWGKGDSGQIGNGSSNMANTAPQMVMVNENGSNVPLVLGTFAPSYSCTADGGFCSLSTVQLAESNGAFASIGALDLEVTGIGSGQTVNIYADSSCSTSSLMGSVSGAASGTLNISGLNDGSHRYYFTETGKYEIACSFSFLTHQVDRLPEIPAITVAASGSDSTPGDTSEQCLFGNVSTNFQ